MPFAEDLAPFFSIAGFATAVVFNGALSVNAIFDNAYFEAEQTVGTQPQLTCKTADLATVAVGASVVVNGTSYTVANIEPDGTGVSVVQLQRT